MSIRIILADDHGVLRAGLRALLNAELDMDVVGEAADGRQAIQLAMKYKPDVILMDISMPDITGLDAMREIKNSQPDMRVLLLTVHEDSSIMREAIRVGAAGYIIKRAAESELINAIQAVMRGELYVHPAMTRALWDEPLSARTVPTAEETLTLREIQILKLIAQGYTNRQIAGQLSLSVRTVESHRANLMDKLGLRSRVELVRYASQRGLIDTGARS